MLYITCPITGISNKLQWPVGVPSGSLETQHPHPILSLSITELNTLPLSGTKLQRGAILAAYCYQLGQNFGLVKFRAPFPVEALSERWITQAIPKAAKLATWLALNGGQTHKSNFPRLVVDSDAASDSLQFWLDTCLEVIEGLREVSAIQYYSRQSAKRAGQSLDSAAEAKEAAEYDKAAQSGTAYHQIAKLRSVHSFVKSKLQQLEQLGIINIGIAKHIGEVLARPKDFPLSRVRQVRQFAFEYLPDEKLEDYNDKQVILEQLDKIILAGSSAADMLAGTAKVETLLGAAPFTVLVDGTKPAQVTQPQQLPAPETEPQRQDYANDLAFMVAVRKFRSQGAKK